MGIFLEPPNKLVFYHKTIIRTFIAVVAGSGALEDSPVGAK